MSPLVVRRTPEPRGAYLVVGESGHQLVAARAGARGLFGLVEQAREADADILALLRSPPAGIAAMVDAVELPPLMAVLELRVGPTLEDLMSGPGSVPVEIAAFIALQVCAALTRLRAVSDEWALDPGRVIVDVEAGVTLQVWPTLPANPYAAQIMDPRVRWTAPEQVRALGFTEAELSWVASLIVHDLVAGRTLFNGEGALARMVKIMRGEFDIDEAAPAWTEGGLVREPEDRAPWPVVEESLRSAAAGVDDDDLQRWATDLCPDLDEARALIEELSLLA